MIKIYSKLIKARFLSLRSTTILITFFISSNFAQSQENWKLFPSSSEDSPKGAANVVTSNKAVEALLENDIRHSRKNPGVDGYRVQIYFGSGAGSKQAANNAQSAFLSEYPDIACYLLYQAPNFKVRVGDCQDKLCAERLKNDISEKYPNAFITRDMVGIQQQDEE